MYQTKKLLHSKRNFPWIKRQQTKWEMIFANNSSDNRLMPQIYKELIQLNTQQTNNTIKKWADNLNTHFSGGDIQMANGYMKRYSIH